MSTFISSASSDVSHPPFSYDTSVVFIVSALRSPPPLPPQHSTYLRCPSLKGTPHAATQLPVICSNYTFASLHIDGNRDPPRRNQSKKRIFARKRSSERSGEAGAAPLPVAGNESERARCATQTALGYLRLDIEKSNRCGPGSVHWRLSEAGGKKNTGTEEPLQAANLILTVKVEHRRLRSQL